MMYVNMNLLVIGWPGRDLSKAKHQQHLEIEKNTIYFSKSINKYGQRAQCLI